MADYLSYVNVKQGTDSEPRFSTGNTLPLTALPHALAAFTPQSKAGAGTFFYNPRARYIEGVRLTHQPSPWVGDFSYFTFLPQSGGVYVNEDTCWCGLRKSDAELMPHYMRVRFARYGATLSLAPTDSGAVLRLDYECADPRFALIAPAFDGEVTIDAESGTITGYTTSKSYVPAREMRCYFVLRFDCAFTDVRVTDRKEAKEGTHLHAVGAGANVGLTKNCVTCRMAISYISPEQALCNLARDAGEKTFAQIRDRAAEIWNTLLGKIEIDAGEKRKKTFYSCLYRAFLYPTKFYETDENGNAKHLVPETGEIKPGVLYVNNGFWDTYRTVYALYSLLIPDKMREIVQGYLNFYDDTGYLPRWPSPSEFGCMPGTLIEAVLADAVVKDILPTADAERALAAMLKNATVPAADPRQGRKSIPSYEKLGYVPYTEQRESVNETLDCAYGDWCIATVAEHLGHSDVAEKFFARSRNYRNLFDRATGFMRARDEKGAFRPDFDPYSWGRDYTEGSAWQNSFAVPHDMAGLAECYGGADKLMRKIDELFAAPVTYRVGGYGIEIHEMTEMAAVDFGQCAISNQPSFHIPYIYSELGNVKKTQKQIKRLVKEAFTADDDGLPGDEDNGTMASWYVLSCLGIYPMCPGRADFTTGAVCVDKARVTTAAGKTLTIEPFGSKVKNKIAYSALMGGGNLAAMLEK